MVCRVAGSGPEIIGYSSSVSEWGFPKDPGSGGVILLPDVCGDALLNEQQIQMGFALLQPVGSVATSGDAPCVDAGR